MTRPLLLLASLLWVLLASAAPAEAAPPHVTVVARPDRVSTTLGDEFVIRTQLTNTSGADTGQLLVHLNVASLDGRAYVDPEDWSSERSQDISLKPGENRTLSWDIQAVNSGSFAAYVVVLPAGGADEPAGALVVSPMIKIEVADRSTLNAAGALQVGVVVPVLLGGLALAAHLRHRRRA
jgi:uncharacterized membrane protein